MTPISVPCGNDAHQPRRAHFRVTWPDQRHRPTTACLACARMLISEAAGGDYSIHFEAVCDQMGITRERQP